MIKMTYYCKTGKVWNEQFTIENETFVYKKLCEDLIAKKLSKCTYIKSIKRKQLYNGYIEVTVAYLADGIADTKTVYTVESH